MVWYWSSKGNCITSCVHYKTGAGCLVWRRWWLPCSGEGDACRRTWQNSCGARRGELRGI